MAATVQGPGAATAQPFSEVGLAAGFTVPQRPAVPPPDCEGGFYACAGHYTGGVAVGDLDGDDWPDVVLSRPEAPSLVYRNQHDGTFSDVSAQAGLPTLPGANGVALVDVDGDGDLDVVLSQLGWIGHRVYLNQWPGAFVDVTDMAGLDAGTSAVYGGSSIAVGDFDRDGRLDLYTSEWVGDTRCSETHERLYRGLGGGGARLFEDVTERMQVSLTDPAVPMAWSFGAGFSDLDADGWPDLLVTSDFGTSRLFFGGDSRPFEEATVSAGVGTEGYGMGTTVGDFDGDGRLDVYVTSITLDPGRPGGSHRLYLNRGSRRFEDATAGVGLQVRSWGWGVAGFDADHDGDLDLIAAAGLHHQTGASADPIVFLENQGDATFVERAVEVGIDETHPTRGLAILDFDRDGDSDVIVVRHGDTPLLYRNDGGAALGDYLRVRAQGTRGNRQGLGAVVRVTVGGRTWVAETNSVTHYLGQSEQVAHVGLGTAAMSRSAEVRVRFLGGHEVTQMDVPLNQEITVVEPDLPFPDAPSTLPEAVDCNDDGLWDACAPDCDGNRRADACDLDDGSVLDCNLNDVPDSCEVAAGFERDCDLDGALDSCEVAAGLERDCDLDGQLDSCEVAVDPALDCDGDGWLDACLPVSCASDGGMGPDAGPSTDLAVRDVGEGNADAAADLMTTWDATTDQGPARSGHGAGCSASVSGTGGGTTEGCGALLGWMGALLVVRGSRRRAERRPLRPRGIPR